jgi:hypothetical protein
LIVAPTTARLRFPGLARALMPAPRTRGRRRSSNRQFEVYARVGQRVAGVEETAVEQEPHVADPGQVRVDEGVPLAVDGHRDASDVEAVAVTGADGSALPGPNFTM